MATTLMSSSTVKRTVKIISSASDSGFGSGESGLLGGPWMASTIELTMITTSVTNSSQRCSTSQTK